MATLNVAAGFHSDVCKLLEKFSHAPEIQMKEFTKIWREMEFLKIFMCREGKELVMFTEECFRILLRLILSQQPVQFKVGAFYCLYSVYIMQPSNPKVKIRVVPDSWKGFHSLIDESQLEPWENEIKFAFWSLAYQGAFLFVSKQNSMGFVQTSSDENVFAVSNIRPVIEDYMNSDHQLLLGLHSRYIDLKDSMTTCAAKTVQMLDKDLLNALQRDVDTLEKKFGITSNVTAQENEEDSESEYNPSEEEQEGDEDDTFERRRKVRLKHQALQVQQSKSRRHRDAEEASREQNVSPKKGRPRGAITSTDKRRVAFEEDDRPFQDVGAVEFDSQ